MLLEKHIMTEPITIALTKENRQQANKFAQKQSTRQRAEQVYRNTLAVLATQHFLEVLGIETDLERSHCWNPLEQQLENIADLYIPALNGYLECRAIHKQDSKCYFPPEVQSERTAYVIVEIDEPYQVGEIIGFVPSVSVSELPRSYFQPLDAFLEYLIPDPVIDDPVIVKLGNWVQGKFELDWQPQRDLLERMTAISKKTPSPVMKSSPVMRDINLVLETPSEEDLVNDICNTQDDNKRWQSAELLWQKNPQHSACPIISAKDLGVYLLGYSLALMVGIVPKSDGEILIILRVYSLEQEPYLLPTGLKLTITDLRDNIVVTTMESQTGDIYIESKINGSSGEYFSVTVTLSDSSFTQEFVI
ncbi:DUF1822 family protein [Aphanizomenon sp. UHCC 0183]|nr:DUF1822 family protein [Aphanizomenon sp. UHCC 0183]